MEIKKVMKQSMSNLRYLSGHLALITIFLAETQALLTNRLMRTMIKPHSLTFSERW